MKTPTSWVPALLASVFAVLLLWGAAEADHAGVTFDQVSGDPGGIAIRGTATGGLSALPPIHGARGLVGRATGPAGQGVVGEATDLATTTDGVFGSSASPTGRGVVGQGFFGVLGVSLSSGGVGVEGNSRAPTGEAVGVHGLADSSPLGRGVLGQATAATGRTIGVEGLASSTSGRGVVGLVSAASGETIGVHGVSGSKSGRGVVGEASASSGRTVGVQGVARSPTGAAIQGIGSNGALAGAFSGNVKIDGHLFVHGMHIADLAEDLPAKGRVTAGDVVVLTGTTEYAVARANSAYDTRVAGIVSAQPRLHLQVRQKGRSVPVAMAGIVKAKATATNGAIRIGDILTTSRVPGHLMRCPETRQCAGAIVGKALQPLMSGQQQILVLLWRQ